MIQWNYETLRCKQGTLRIMVGRPRKRGRRERNGQLRRQYVNPKAFVANQPHRRLAPPVWREREEAGSNFGQLFCHCKITAAQYEAGKQYAELAEKYLAVYGLPPLNPRSANLLAVRGQPKDVQSDIAREVRLEYNRAFESCGSAKAQRAVKFHCVQDQPVLSEFVMGQLVTGLDRLVIHFGIDEGLKITSVK